PIPAVHQNAQLPGARIAPRRDAAMHEPRPVRHLPIDIRLRVVRPQFAASLGVERDHAIVWRRKIERLPDENGRRLKHTASRVEVGQRLLARLPLPKLLELRNIRAINLLKRKVVRTILGVTTEDEQRNGMPHHWRSIPHVGQAIAFGGLSGVVFANGWPLDGQATKGDGLSYFTATACEYSLLPNFNTAV